MIYIKNLQEMNEKLLLNIITYVVNLYFCVVKHKKLDDMIKKMKNFFVRGLQHMGDNELQAWKLNNK